jgi:hypothetical protein
MTSPITHQQFKQLEKWKELADAATPGPWGVMPAGDNPTNETWVYEHNDIVLSTVATLGFPDHPQVQVDAAFIAAAREAVPALLKLVDELWDKLDDQHYAAMGDDL